MGSLFADALGARVSTAQAARNPTPAGLHVANLTFTATTAGSYRYLCPVPGHAQKGTTGTFTVSST